ncbi:hypothetical protein [Spirillospora sp. NBC_01491]|uniref:hypothetical protein n=1 Tax=Spirillospora sp. NBC_01491 TaxID=2976007 RepID=UPI002E304579|nr:hypothetical protein [Spirillospora sp. NBC_01491]
MSGVAGIVLALVLLRYLLRSVARGGGGGGQRITLRFRTPLRERYPRFFWTVVGFVLLVVAPVLLLAGACDWWGL